MNAERLRTAVTGLLAELDTKTVIQRLTELESALQSALSNSGNEAMQQGAMTVLQDLQRSFDAPSPDASVPFQDELLRDTGLGRYLPRSIAAMVRAILDSNPMMPGIALNEIRNFRSEINDAQNRMKALIENLDWVQVAAATPDQTRYELALLIPRQSVGSDLDRFVSDLQDLDRLLKLLSEATTGATQHIEIESISSSNFIVNLLLESSTAASAVAAAAGVILLAVKRYYEVLVVREQVMALRMPKSVVANLDRNAAKIIPKAIKKSANDVVSKSPVDEGRKNELRTHLEAQFARLAQRLQEGYDLDIQEPSMAATDAAQNDVHVQITDLTRLIKEVRELRLTTKDLPKLTAGDAAADDDANPAEAEAEEVDFGDDEDETSL